MTTRAALLLFLLSNVAWAAPIAELKPLYPQTPLCAGGQARAVIVAPESLAAPAKQLAGQIKNACGVQLEIVRPEQVVSAEWRLIIPVTDKRSLIALGNINDNRLLAVLWGGGYLVADSLYPGPGGYVVRTVHDPFARGANVVALNGSDAAGVQRAVDAFAGKHLTGKQGECVLAGPIMEADLKIVQQRFYPGPVDSLSSKRQPQYSGLDYFQQLFKGEKLMDVEGRVVARPDGNLATVTGAIARLAQTYFWTGNPALPPLMKDILDKNRPLLKIVPRRVEMEASSAAHVPWWDVIEELPVWTDQDRLDVTNALLADALQGHEKRAAHKMVEEGYLQVVDENHGTNSAQNSLLAWGYFDKYYKLPESDYWMKVVRATFAGQAASHQILEDACGYLCYAPIDSMQYAMATRDLTYLTRGVARTQAEFIAQCSVNNLGLASGFGDDGSLIEPGVFEALAPAAWYYRDPSLAWVCREFLPQSAGLRTFQSALPFDFTVQPKEPKQWTGLSIFPIYKQTLRKGEGARQLVFDPCESAGPQWFNKAVFREKWSPDAQYLMLDGAGKFGTPEGYPNSPAGHMHSDVNTIINFTDEGRMWLVDHTYPTRSIKDHSGLYITRNGGIQYQVHEAKLQVAAQNDRFALTTSKFDDFSGADWERSIFWDKGRHFVVLDRAIAKEPGEYLARCSFRGLGEDQLVGSALRLTQGDKACTIISDGRGRLDVEQYELPSAEEFRIYYKHAEPVVRIFQQDKQARLEPGQEICFINLIKAGSSAAETDGVMFKPLSTSAVLVEDAGDKAVYGVGQLPGGWGGAGSFAVSDKSAVLGNLRRLGKADQPLLAATEPVTLYWQPGQKVRMEASKPTQLTIAGTAQQLALPVGSTELPLAGQATVQKVIGAILDEAPALAAKYAAETALQAPPPSFGVKSRAAQIGKPVAILKLVDLDGDGRQERISAGAQGVRASREDGTCLWVFATPQPCRALDVADLDGDGKPEVAVGCDDTKLYLLGADGKERWNFTCKTTKSPTAAVDWVEIADLDGDDKPEIVVGAAWVHCLDAAGQVKWEKYLCQARGSLAGNFARGTIADLNGDGKLETVALFYYSYPKAVVFGADGSIILPKDHDNDKNPGMNIDTPQALLVTGLFGAKNNLNLVVGSPNYLYTYWGAGTFSGQFGGRNAGSYTHLGTLQPAEDAVFVYGATDLGTVIAYRTGPRRNDAYIMLNSPWSRETGEKITSMWTGDSNGDGQGEVWVGTKSGGAIAYAAASGEPLCRSQVTGSPVVLMLPAPAGLLAVHDDGTTEELTLSK
ncbi:MAG: FG-GAP repeat domain-containing protein [Armatimonadota bacterium]